MSFQMYVPTRILFGAGQLSDLHAQELSKLQEQCGVSELKMSDYGIRPEEFLTLAQNARATMGGLFACDRVPLSDEECAEIFRKSWQ